MKVRIKTMRLKTVYIPEGLLKQLGELVEKGYYPNKSEAIRLAIRLLIQEHESTCAKGA